MRKPISVCLLIAAAATLLSAAQQAVSTSTSQRDSPSTPKKTQLLSSRKEPPMPMPLVAPLFIEDEKRTSVITVVSDAPSSSLVLDVTLLSPSGEPLTEQTVRINPHGEKSIAVADLLATLPISRPVYGSISLRPHRSSTFAAQLSITGRAGTAVDDIEEEFAMPMDERPANYRAVTALQRPLIAVRSLSGRQETLVMDCMTNKRLLRTSTISIAPSQMLLLRACSNAGTAPVPNLEEAERREPADRPGIPIALSISSSTPASKLLVFGVGLAKEPSSEFSAIPFTDINELRSSTEIFPGAANVAGTISGGSLTLQAALANFSMEPRTASVFLSSNGARQVLQTLLLPARSISAALPINLGGNGDGSLVIQGDGTPGEIIGSISAVAATSTSSVSLPLPWKDQKQIPNGGQHPWRIDGAFRSTLMLYNPDPQTSNIVDVSIYTESKEWAKAVTVAPLSTTLINLNEIIGERQKDDTDRVLSVNATQGLATWRTLADPKIFGTLVQNNPATGVLRPYACAQTYAVCQVTTDPLTLAIGSSDTTYANLSACGTNGDCSCVESCGSGGTSASSYSWYVGDNSGVVSLTSDPTFSYGQYTANKSGNTYSAVAVVDNLGCVDAGTGPITVQMPTASRITATTANNALSSGQYPCDPGFAGWIRLVTKIVTDQNGRDIVRGSQNLTEQVSIGSPNDLNITGVQTGTTITDSNGLFHDTLYVCSSLCPQSGGQTVATQTISDTYLGYTYTLQPNTFTYTCNGIQINGQ